MSFQKLLMPAKLLLASSLLLISVTFPTAWASGSVSGSSPGGGARNSSAPVRYRASRFPKRAGEYYGLVWGVDSLSVKAVESGALIRFTYRVLDPEKAKLLSDKSIDAFLNSPDRHIQLVVPSLEKVGQLRQTNEPESGRVYWMAFSNPRRTIKPGDRVDVVIGRFHANGLQVQ